MSAYSAHRAAKVTTGTTAIQSTGTRLHAVWFSATAAGTVNFTDGGTSRFAFDVVAGQNYIRLPDGGIRFNNDLTAIVPASCSITAIYE